MLTIDGHDYDVLIPFGGISRAFSIAEGPGSLAFLDGDEDPDIVGTYYSYDIEIDTRRTQHAEYDALFEVLSAPVKQHTFTFPYGQSSITFVGRVTSGGDTFDSRLGGVTTWGGLRISVRSKAPVRVPS